MAMNVTTPETAENNTEQLTFFSHGALGHPTRSTLNKAQKIGCLATLNQQAHTRKHHHRQRTHAHDQTNEETQEQSTRTEPNRRRSFESTTRN